MAVHWNPRRVQEYKERMKALGCRIEATTYPNGGLRSKRERRKDG